ncbi:MAG: ABC transporter substrate-binding protein [Thermaerobacter sp.]|nr:ABC transporter substrate-binding protein [Thermaerobacter sp.]
MKPHLRYFAPLLAVALLAAGCGPTAAATGPIHLKDDVGHAITLKRPAVRIISLGPSNTETLLSLGLRKDIVGIDDESVQYVPPPYAKAVKGLTVVGDSYSGLNVEKITALHPQLILAIPGVADLKELQALGIPIATMEPGSLAGIERDISFIADAAGVPAQGAKAVAAMKRKVSAVAAAVAKVQGRPSVYVELDPTQYYSAGPGSFLDALVKIAGGRNIADSIAKTPYPQLSSESIITQSPQVVVLLDTPAATAATVRSRPGWSGIRAVRDGRIYTNINPDLLSQPAPAIVQGLTLLAQDLHPGLRIP